jgi:hypothetical protein
MNFWALPDYPRGPHPAPPAAPIERTTWLNVQVTLNPSTAELSVINQGKTATLRNPDAQRLRDGLPDDIKARLKSKRLLKGCEVQVEPIGNALKLQAILAVGEVRLASGQDNAKSSQE